MRYLRNTALFFVTTLVVLTALSFFTSNHSISADWRTASKEPVGIAPNPAIVKEAVVQVYSARAFSWRGLFGVHTWISVKEENAQRFTNYEVIGWRVRRGSNAVSTSYRAPDSRWFGAAPEIIADVRGEKAAAMIPQIQTAANTYPYMKNYTVWPGPNSNTFVAHVARQVPDLKVDMPPTAVGKDYIPDGSLVALTPSGTGAQISVFGLLGVMAGVEEGVEVNVLGLTFGIDPLDLAIKLPMVGRIGLK